MSRALALAVAGLSLAVPCSSYAQTILFQESFEDTNFSSRGWYDSTGGALSTAEKFAGARSFECRFLNGGNTCNGGNIARHALAATDSIYISYYVKHSSNWVGSGKPYHPHMFYFLTNLDGPFSGLAYTHMTAYVENLYQSGGQLQFMVQDGVNIDETRIGVNLTAVTENRAVGGCNGDSDGYGDGQCYVSGAVHWNGKIWSAGQGYFTDTPGTPRYKGGWHLVEAYFRLNSIVNVIGTKDGIIRYWYDGVLVMEHTNIVMRTGVHPTIQFNQLVVSPYIGDGSPTDQTMWIDNLTIATARPAVPPPPPGGAVAPKAPTNFRIVP